MYRSKQELDMKVREILSKLNSDEERLLRCIQFARLYMGLREFETALKYLNEYVTVPTLPKQFQAYNMMGDILVELNQHEDALAYYKRSYEMMKSRDVLNKICSLMQNGYGMTETVQSKALWLELLKTTACLSDDIDVPSPSPRSAMLNSPMSSVTPSRSVGVMKSTNSPNFFSSTRSDTSMNRKNRQEAGTTESMKDMLLGKVASNQATVDQHVALLQFYITDREFREGSQHVNKYMLKYSCSYKFLEKSALIMEEATKLLNSKEAVFSTGAWLTEAESYAAFFFVLENLVAILLLDKFQDDALGLIRNKRLNVASEWLFKLDQLLYRKGPSVKASPLECWWMSFLKHIRCQVALFYGLLGITRTSNLMDHAAFLPCFTMASSYVVDQPVSLIKLLEPKLQQRIYIESSFRLLVCNRFLKDSSCYVTATKELKQRVYELSLNVQQNTAYGSAKTSSEFLNSPCKEWQKATTFSSLCEEKFWLYLKSAQYLYPECLDYQVWLQAQGIERLHSGQDHEYYLLHSVVFEGLPFAAHANGRIQADSISQMDVDIFLTASSYLAWCDQFQGNEGFTLAPHFCKNLSTTAQAKWWTYAFRLTHDCQKTSSSDWVVSEYRMTVERGLDMIRNTSKTMPSFLLNTLGIAFCRSAVLIEQNSFSNQILHANVSMDTICVVYFDAAEKYFGMFIEEIDGSNKFLRFFEVAKFPIIIDIKNAVDNARFVLGCRSMASENYDSALAHFNEISLFESSLYAAKIYKMLADEEKSANSSNDAQGRIKALLQKSQELLYAAVDQKEHKSKELLIGNRRHDIIPVPLVQCSIEDTELHIMIDDVEKELNAMVIAPNNRSVNQLLRDSYAELEEDSRKDIDTSDIPSDDFIIRTPAVKGRLSARKDANVSSASPSREPVFIGSSTPRRSICNQTERPLDFSAYVGEAKFIDTLTEILQQNNSILDFVAQVSDEVKDLNDRFENLKRSRRVFVAKGVSDLASHS